ncbi:hypothetical protein GF108_08880 [Phyllobacterium sp. SYP-B3895]|uniref:hypothetical protein n=1 Tax=Phyllobacterium sp. SYP-B3895 TaxID=2663240 RepID=UPI00129988F6|nr:hypothetical protein [Phyllobacterium sp. SYP-B3895]MRG55695.1 hypothetical protein [Phyllobacterium sp. SYP-B3895]
MRKRLEALGARASLADDPTGIREMLPSEATMGLLDKFAAVLDELDAPAVARGRRSEGLKEVATSATKAVAAGMKVKDIVAVARDFLSLSDKDARSLRTMIYEEMRKNGIKAKKPRKTKPAWGLPTPEQ